MKKLDLSTREIILLVIFLISMVLFFTTFYIHWEFLGADPLEYGLEKHKYSGCVCYKEGGYTCFQSDEGFKCKKNSADINIGEVLHGAG